MTLRTGSGSLGTSSAGTRKSGAMRGTVCQGVMGQLAVPDWGARDRYVVFGLRFVRVDHEVPLLELFERSLHLGIRRAVLHARQSDHWVAKVIARTAVN